MIINGVALPQQRDNRFGSICPSIPFFVCLGAQLGLPNAEKAITITSPRDLSVCLCVCLSVIRGRYFPQTFNKKERKGKKNIWMYSFQKDKISFWSSVLHCRSSSSFSRQSDLINWYVVVIKHENAWALTALPSRVVPSLSVSLPHRPSNTLRQLIILRLPYRSDARIAKLCNLWTFWLVIQLMNHLFKIRHKAFLPNVP